MRIALLATGNEIIHGDTLNTNGYHIAHALNSEGLNLGLHLVCSDNQQEIRDCIAYLAQAHDCLIMTGGLGPTSDDRTRFALADYLAQPLLPFPAALHHIQKRCERAHLSMNEGNKQQALFIAHSQLLPNPFGTAMGCDLLVNDKRFILLPGPPRECLPMFNEYILPMLAKIPHGEQQLLKWRLFAVAESQIAEKMESALADLDCQTGYRLDIPYLECKVWCKENEAAEIEKRLDPIFRPYIIASSYQKASEELISLILKHNLQVQIEDYATGGILQNLLQTIETYSLIKFFNPKTSALFYFKLSGLEEYWTQIPNTSYANISIEISHNHNTTHEEHRLPYYSPLVVYSAAEWFCYRVNQKLNTVYK